MHRVLSFHVSSRTENEEAHEFVSKRLCCSFLFTIAFLSTVGGYFLGRWATEKDMVLRSRAMKALEEQNNDLITKLSNTMKNFEDVTSKLPPDLVDNSLMDMLECKNYTYPSLHNTTIVDNVKVMLRLHINLLTNCINDASSYVQNELFINNN